MFFFFFAISLNLQREWALLLCKVKKVKKDHSLHNCKLIDIKESSSIALASLYSVQSHSFPLILLSLREANAKPLFLFI